MVSVCAIRCNVCLFLVLFRLISSSYASTAFVRDESIGIVSSPVSLLSEPQQHTSISSSRYSSDLARRTLIRQHDDVILRIRGGAGFIPAGWNPFGYAMTSIGEEFLQFDGSLDSDIGRFVASLKSSRKTKATIKETWLEIVRVSKTAQAMRIYRKIDEIIDFCLKVGLID
jgi:hypothetical protein